MELSVSSRQSNIKRLSEEDFDFLIIGGGITGAGVARDAASRGLKVALIEMRDFASGTSSRSSKLIHGGIRYLENLEFNLVFEALSERSKLFELAPHLVHPLRFVLPVYKGFRVGMWKLGAGMWLYDALSLFQAPEAHQRLSSRETLSKLPLLRRKGLQGSYIYSDAYMDDDRLVLETLRSAAGLGAICANYVRAESPVLTGGRIGAVNCVDTHTGDRFQVRAKHIISSVGVWSDELGENFIPDWHKLLRPTKGIHLSFSKDRIQIKDAVVMTEGNRIVFAIPRHEMVIIGTTDTDYRDDFEGVRAEKDDVDYLFKVIGEHFPEAKLTQEDVIASYAGVRPLISDDAGETGKTSREHQIFTHPLGVTFVAGGKYTTYRRMASEVVEESLRSFPIERRGALMRPNTESPINPEASVANMQQASMLIENWSEEYQRPKDQIQWLVDRYGMEAQRILDQAPKDYNLWQIEAKQAIEHTMCMHLEDFYFRRVPLFLARKDHGLADLESISMVFKDRLAWSEEQRLREEEQLKKQIQYELQWKQARLKDAP